MPRSKCSEHVVSFMEEAHYLAKASINLRAAAILALDTGMGPNGELLLLNWAEVDLIARAESP